MELLNLKFSPFLGPLPYIVAWNSTHLVNSCNAPLLLDFLGLNNTRRKSEINDSINDSFLSRLGHKLQINDSNPKTLFELL
jgi:hypothetical protein